MTILDRIDRAARPYDFESIAVELEASGQLEAYMKPIRDRLKSIDLDLAKRLGEYCQRLVKSGDLEYEEIHKVFSLTASLARFSKFGLDRAQDWLEVVAKDIKAKRETDCRYGFVREDIYGTTLPEWWIP